jgi:small-conductance mechanosensitive channel
MESIKEFLNIELINAGELNISVNTFFIIILIILITKLAIWLLKKTLLSRKSSKRDEGDSYALFHIIRYVLWIIAFGLVLETIGFKLTLLIAGSAALLVGIGLGLQQTFNDILSGIILLSEKSIKIGDVLDIDDDVVKIQSIGLRTSKALDTDDVSIIIPNSLITTNKVINWSHQTKMNRFRIDVGVAYGSDIDLVMKILEESALEHPDVSDRESTEVRLVNFGNSSLDFQVLFFSKNIFRISKVKSDIRRSISRKLADNKIVIPFPQMDLHLKSNYTELGKEDNNKS